MCSKCQLSLWSIEFRIIFYVLSYHSLPARTACLVFISVDLPENVALTDNLNLFPDNLTLHVFDFISSIKDTRQMYVVDPKTKLFCPLCSRPHKFG